MIKLSRMADYGVLLMAELARDTATLRTAAELATSVALPAPTVAKLLKQFTQAGLLSSYRGIKGGYALARAPEAISMADIIAAVDGPISLTECGDSTTAGCDIESLCPTRTNWRRINEAVSEALSRVSLAEMAYPESDFMAMFPEPRAASGDRG